MTFGPNKTTDIFLGHVRDSYNSLSKYVSAGRLRLKLVSVGTFGAADAIVVWQAKDDEAIKDFRDIVLAGDGHHCNTIHAMMSGTHG